MVGGGGGARAAGHSKNEACRRLEVGHWRSIAVQRLNTRFANKLRLRTRRKI